MTRWIVGIALLFGILLLMLPKTDEQSLARIASASMLMCSKDFRAVVAERVRHHQPVTERFENGCPDLIAALTVGADGQVTITGNKYGIRMSLRPVTEANRVRWSCRGQPVSRITRLCRP